MEMARMRGNIVFKEDSLLRFDKLVKMFLFSFELVVSPVDQSFFSDPLIMPFAIVGYSTSHFSGFIKFDQLK